jgi:xylulokinase
VLLGLDVGTSGCKASIFTLDGQLVSFGYREYSDYSPKPGWIELNPSEVWIKVQEAIKDALRKKGCAEELKALGISSLGEAILPIDKSGNPLYPAITAYDQRSNNYAKTIEMLKHEFGEMELFKITGIPLNSMPSIHKIVWIKENMPDIYRKTWKFVCIEDFIIYKLTGEAAIDFNLASRTMMLDIFKRRWHPEILNLIDISEDLLSNPVPSGTIVGETSSKVSKEIGLPKGLSVATGGHDQGCAALGAGIGDEGPTMDATGSVECIASVMKNPVLTEEMLKAGHCCHCYTIENMYISLGFFPSSGLILRWFRDQFAFEERKRAEEEGSNVYDILTELASTSPPTASKLLLLPHFCGSGTGSQPVLNRNSRGALVGLTIYHKKADVVRAILEGVAFELKQLIEHFESSGIKVSELRATGGGAKSPFWLQLKADVTGKCIYLPSVTETTSLGAALLAGIGVRAYKSFKDAIEKTYKWREVYKPNEKLNKQYAKIYETYKMLYPALVNLYESLAII